MSHPLIDLTEQEIFEKAYSGISGQGFKKSTKGWSPAYSDGKGKHSAIGWVCVGSVMPKEGNTPWSDAFWNSIKVERPNDDRVNFLQELHIESHPDFDNSIDLKLALENFAKKYNLTIPN